MRNDKLPDQLKLGRITLTVSDLERSTAFYERSIGLVQLNRNDSQTSLGTERSELVLLKEDRYAKRLPRRTGLYHFALLVPRRQDLGNALRNLIATNTQLKGGADHLVSEALYLDDPDGNGIEIYRDRPREAWRSQDGRLQMDTLPLDFEGLLADASGDPQAHFRLHPNSRLGHMHLHVAHIARAIEFYRDVVGFDLIMTYGPSAAFLSAAGYHHHIGVNTWAGVGAPPPPENAIGLRDFVLVLPDEESTNALIGRLQRAEIAYERDAGGLTVRDPAQNKLRIVVADR